MTTPLPPAVPASDPSTVNPATPPAAPGSVPTHPAPVANPPANPPAVPPVQPQATPPQPANPPAAPATGPGAPTTVPQPLATPGQPQPAEPAADPQGKAPTIQGEFDPDRATQTIANLRGAEKTLKAELAAIKKQDEEFKTGLARLLGLAPDEAPDPEKLTAQLNASQSETRQARVELAVYRVAGKHGADPDAVLDSRSFQNAVAQLDPTAADFAAQVDAALADAVASNARLLAAPATPPSAAPAAGQPGQPTNSATALPGQHPAGVSGAPITAPTEGGPITEAALAALHAQGRHDEIARLHAEGRLAHLL